jgi:hypothetical protein
MADENKGGMFAKIENREDALKTIKDVSAGFFVVAAIQGALSFVIGMSILFDAALYAGVGFWLRKTNSRVAAVILLVVSWVGAGVTVANKAGANLGGGNNIFLAVILAWASIRGVEAAFKLKGRFAEATAQAEPQ